MDDSKPLKNAAAAPSAWGDLKPIPHVVGDGGLRPPVIALAGFEERGVSTLEVTGDAMVPDLHSGDLVVFARHCGLVEDGGLYILGGPAGLVVRRLQQMADGAVEAVPTNPACRREVVGGTEGAPIVGAVIAVVHWRF